MLLFLKNGFSEGRKNKFPNYRTNQTATVVRNLCALCILYIKMRHYFRDHGNLNGITGFKAWSKI